MSIESAKAFIERLKADESFARKVGECKGESARMTMAKSEGFDFTVQEIRDLQAELSEEDLEKISGGFRIPCCGMFDFGECHSMNY